MRWILSNLDLICPLLCFVYCIIHTVVQCIGACKLNKKITSLCEKCGSPVVEGDSHECDERKKVLLKSLSDSDIKALYNLLDSLIDTVLKEVDKDGN